MGLAKRYDVIRVAMGIAKACRECEEKHDVYLGVEDCSLRVEKLEIPLEPMIDEEDVENIVKYAVEADCTVEELTDDDLTDGVILCEGRLWETLYNYQAGKRVWIDTDVVKELLSDIINVLRETDFDMDLSDPGRITLMSDESNEAWRKKAFGN